jgi:CheY-like chemotaxis protein
MAPSSPDVDRAAGALARVRRPPGAAGVGSVGGSVAGEPLVVVCTTRGESFGGVRRLFRPQGLEPATADGAAALARLLGAASVQLVLVDAADPRLDLDGVLDVLGSGRASRFLPVLLLGSGARVAHAHERLASQVAVRVLGLEAVRDPLAAGENAELGRASLRRHARVPLRARTRIVHDGVALGGQSHDVSEEGMGVIVTERVAVGREVDVAFSLPGDPLGFASRALVRRTVSLSGGGWFLGLWFPQLAPAERTRLRDFVQRESGVSSAEDLAAG